MSKKQKGRSHLVQDLMQEIRNVFLDLGFDEIENQIFIPEDDVYKQYGSEAPVVLDRCYYLAGLPRPDIGLSREKIEEIHGIIGNFDVDEFKRILRGYREGAIEGDDLTEEMVNKLCIGMNDAIRIIDLFSEFREIKPVPSRVTLRSHMTAAWFITLQAMQDVYDLPLKLFSIGLRFRREQQVDASHLRAHYGASCVLMDNKLDIEEGKRLSKEILEKIGFRSVKFVKKSATSNYYEEGLEFEIFADGIEIADCGMYSKRSLSNYDIRYPVFNIGFGLERILMIRTDKKDVREILYPQFYKVTELSDSEIARQIYIEKLPETGAGKKLACRISEIAIENSEKGSPCEFLVYSGDFLGKKIRVYLVEEESGTKLLGPAALNDIYVYDGNIYGIPKNPERLSKKLSEVKRRGVSANFSYIEAISNLFAFEVEKFIESNEKERVIKIRMAKTPADINISVGKTARRTINSQNKEIFIKGPIFTSLRIVRK